MKTWTTKDKGEVLITEMADEHILNTIKMLRREGFSTILEWEESLAAAYSMHGEMAQYYSFGELDNMKPCHVLDWLIEEAERRGLKIHEHRG